MKVFEIRVETVDIYSGYHSDYEIIGYAHTKENAEKYAKEWGEEIMNTPQWWIGYGSQDGKLILKL